jgi:peptidoglycan hydrolase-like protein with peptidoglycan-binding domain
VLALSLGGCSWVERTTGIGGGDQSAAQTEPAQPAQSSTMSGASQAPAPVSNTAAAAPQNKTMATTSGSGSTMHHPAMHASNEVRMAQQKLKVDGDYMGKIDGLAGPQTRQALMQYQKKNGLKETGHLDHETLSKLGVGGGSAASSGSSMPPAAGSAGGSSDNGSSGSTGSSPAPATGNGGNNTTAPPAGTNSGGNGHQL